MKWCVSDSDDVIILPAALKSRQEQAKEIQSSW